jgi:hypothetical protein
VRRFIQQIANRYSKITHFLFLIGDAGNADDEKGKNVLNALKKNLF